MQLEPTAAPVLENGDDDDGDGYNNNDNNDDDDHMPMVGLTPSILLNTTTDHPRPAPHIASTFDVDNGGDMYYLGDGDVDDDMYHLGDGDGGEYQSVTVPRIFYSTGKVLFSGTNFFRYNNFTFSFLLLTIYNFHSFKQFPDRASAHNPQSKTKPKSEPNYQTQGTNVST